MDNLTHTLFGAVLGEAGLKRRTALATPVLLIGANLPDIDIVAAFVGHSLSFRRGWTHGVLAIAVLPLLLTAGLLAWHRLRRGPRGGPVHPPVRPGQLLLLSYVGVLSHPFLDWLNSYGLRWLMPFDGTWFYGDALFIIDPWVLALLAIGVIAGRRYGISRAAGSALAVVLIYMVGMLGSAAWGRDYVEQRMRDEGVAPDAVMVGPVPLDPNLRQVIVRQGDRYMTGELRLVSRELVLGDPIPASLDDPAALAATEDPAVRRFLTWSRFPFVIVDSTEAGHTVRFDDLRYASRRTGSFASVEVFVPRGADRETSRTRDP